MPSISDSNLRPALWASLIVIWTVAMSCAPFGGDAGGVRISFSHVTSLGDMADVDFGDLLDYLAGDTRSRAILIYMEAVTRALDWDRNAKSSGQIRAVSKTALNPIRGSIRPMLLGRKHPARTAGMSGGGRLSARRTARLCKVIGGAFVIDPVGYCAGCREAASQWISSLSF